MGYQLYCDRGKLRIWSTIVDRFATDRLTPEEVAGWIDESERRRYVKGIACVVEGEREGKKLTYIRPASREFEHLMELMETYKKSGFTSIGGPRVRELTSEGWKEVPPQSPMNAIRNVANVFCDTLKECTDDWREKLEGYFNEIHREWREGAEKKLEECRMKGIEVEPVELVEVRLPRDEEG